MASDSAFSRRLGDLSLGGGSAYGFSSDEDAPPRLQSLPVPSPRRRMQPGDVFPATKKAGSAGNAESVPTVEISFSDPRALAALNGIAATFSVDDGRITATFKSLNVDHASRVLHAVSCIDRSAHGGAQAGFYAGTTKFDMPPADVVTAAGRLAPGDVTGVADVGGRVRVLARTKATAVKLGAKIMLPLLVLCLLSPVSADPAWLLPLTSTGYVPLEVGGCTPAALAFPTHTSTEFSVDCYGPGTALTSSIEMNLLGSTTTVDVCHLRPLTYREAEAVTINIIVQKYPTWASQGTVSSGRFQPPGAPFHYWTISDWRAYVETVAAVATVAGVSKRECYTVTSPPGEFPNVRYFDNPGVPHSSRDLQASDLPVADGTVVGLNVRSVTGGTIFSQTKHHFHVDPATFLLAAAGLKVEKAPVFTGPAVVPPEAFDGVPNGCAMHITTLYGSIVDMQECSGMSNAQQITDCDSEPGVLIQAGSPFYSEAMWTGAKLHFVNYAETEHATVLVPTEYDICYSVADSSQVIARNGVSLSPLSGHSTVGRARLVPFAHTGRRSARRRAVDDAAVAYAEATMELVVANAETIHAVTSRISSAIHTLSTSMHEQSIILANSVSDVSARLDSLDLLQRLASLYATALDARSSVHTNGPAQASRTGLDIENSMCSPYSVYAENATHIGRCVNLDTGLITYLTFSFTPAGLQIIDGVICEDPPCPAPAPAHCPEGMLVPSSGGAYILHPVAGSGYRTCNATFLGQVNTVYAISNYTTATVKTTATSALISAQLNEAAVQSAANVAGAALLASQIAAANLTVLTASFISKTETLSDSIASVRSLSDVISWGGALGVAVSHAVAAIHQASSVISLGLGIVAHLRIRDLAASKGF